MGNSRSGRPTTDNEYGGRGAGSGDDEHARRDAGVAGPRGAAAHGGETLNEGARADAATERVSEVAVEGRAGGGIPTASWQQRYEDGGALARGGMSVIHTVFDRVMQRQVAMKVYDGRRDPVGLARFLDEARLTGALDHPNIVPVHDVQQDDGPLPTRFTMKLVQGETLADLLERDGDRRLESTRLEEFLRIFLKVCDAVSFAHSRGVIHCDVKPSNVMVGSHGQVYLMDWGVAWEPERSPDEGSPPRDASPQGAVSGTPAYMAPEQAWGRTADIDRRTDIYGLGGLLYATLTLRPPHDGRDGNHDLELARAGKVTPPHEATEDGPLPPGLCEITMRALDPDPKRRFPSVELLREAVEGFLRGGGWFSAVHFAQGEVIVREGDPPDAAYIITEGRCEIFRELEGQRRTIREVGRGEVFGETSIFGSSRRTASVLATSNVTALRVTRDALERELERTGWLKPFVEALAGRFIERDQRVRELEDAGD
jgi:serine/threonine-protein kinase